MLQNVRVTAFTVSELLRENQEVGYNYLPPPPPPAQIYGGISILVFISC